MNTRMRRKPRYVTIHLEGEIAEDPSGGSLFSSKPRLPLGDLLKILRTARRDKRFRAVLLIIKNPSIGWNQVEELHQELDQLRKAGKPTWAFLEQGNNLSYYLASGADQILMPPLSHLDFVGLRLELHFFQGLLSMLGIEPELQSIGRYKSAAEIFTRQDMSEANREALNAILDDYQERLTERVARRTGKSRAEVQECVDAGPYSSQTAKAKGLVDQLLYEDELESLIQTRFSGIRSFASSKLAPRQGRLKRLFTHWRPRVAYLVAQGLITEGRSPRGPGGKATIGSDSLRELLERAREDRRVKAVLLRIDSSGGSAIASDLIWREVRRTAQDKPVIVSMGATAASGGYYIASAANRVFAMPSTLTGSIGVIAGKFNAASLLSTLRIGVDSVSKGAHAAHSSPSLPYSEEEVTMLREEISETYGIFVDRVSEGRGRKREEILGVAEGRVWTGAQALQRRLVDELGGIEAAVEAAREAAGIPRKRKIRVDLLSRRRRLRDYFSLPLVEASLASRLWAILPTILRIR